MPASNPTHHGDEAALFQEHYDGLVGGLLALGARLEWPLETRELAEDAVQFAFAQLLAHQPDREAFDIVGWLFTTAKREFWASIRRKGPELSGFSEDLTPVRAMASLQDLVEARDKLRLLNQLKPAQAQVLRLRMVGLSYREVCEATGKTYTWVNRHNAEGLAALRVLMDAQESQGGE